METTVKMNFPFSLEVISGDVGDTSTTYIGSDIEPRELGSETTRNARQDDFVRYFFIAQNEKPIIIKTKSTSSEEWWIAYDLGDLSQEIAALIPEGK